MCIKDMIYDTKNTVLDRSVDIRFAIARQGELDEPIKSVSMHRRCTTPLWKIALWIALGLLLLIVFKKAKSKSE